MLKQTLRTLRRSGGVTVVAVLALALEIGANTAVFSVVNAVFVRPLPFAEGGRLVAISETNGNTPTSVSYPDFLDCQGQASAFEAMAVTGSYEATLEGRVAAERLHVTYVSSELFPILRTRPLLGRDFRREDGREGAHPVAILSHRIWQTHFGSNPAILGATVSLDRRPYTVIGVLPQGFRFAGDPAGRGLAGAADRLRERRRPGAAGPGLHGCGRPGPGVASARLHPAGLGAHRRAVRHGAGLRRLEAEPGRRHAGWWARHERGFHRPAARRPGSGRSGAGACPARRGGPAVADTEPVDERAAGL